MCFGGTPSDAGSGDGADAGIDSRGGRDPDAALLGADGSVLTVHRVTNHDVSNATTEAHPDRRTASRAALCARAAVPNGGVRYLRLERLFVRQRPVRLRREEPERLFRVPSASSPRPHRLQPTRRLYRRDVQRARRIPTGASRRCCQLHSTSHQQLGHDRLLPRSGRRLAHFSGEGRCVPAVVVDAARSSLGPSRVEKRVGHVAAVDLPGQAVRAEVLVRAGHDKLVIRHPLREEANPDRSAFCGVRSDRRRTEIHRVLPHESDQGRSPATTGTEAGSGLNAALTALNRRAASAPPPPSRPPSPGDGHVDEGNSRSSDARSAHRRPPYPAALGRGAGVRDDEGRGRPTPHDRLRDGDRRRSGSARRFGSRPPGPMLVADLSGSLGVELVAIDEGHVRQRAASRARSSIRWLPR